MCSYTGIGICITRRLFVHSFILGKNIVFGNRREIDKRYRRVYRARESTVRRSSYLTRETCRWGSEIGFSITRRPFIHSFILGKNMVFADRREIKKDREEFIERERVQLEGRATYLVRETCRWESGINFCFTRRPLGHAFILRSSQEKCSFWW